MAKIGIMGGTFDPIHYGHLLLGKQAREEYKLDQVWYMPSGQPPHKRGRELSSAADRCAMVRLALSGEPGLVLSEFETSRNGTTYTADTLALLKKSYPAHEFFFILGADSLYEIEGWYHPERIFSSVRLLATEREYVKKERTLDGQISYLHEKFGGSIEKLHCREMHVSSSFLREAVRQGKCIGEYVPAGVAEYIASHHLYQEDEHGSVNSGISEKNEEKTERVQV